MHLSAEYVSLIFNTHVPSSYKITAVNGDQIWEQYTINIYVSD